MADSFEKANCKSVKPPSLSSLQGVVKDDLGKRVNNAKVIISPARGNAKRAASTREWAEPSGCELGGVGGDAQLPPDWKSELGGGLAAA
jgi:hypothetical protein